MKHRVFSCFIVFCVAGWILQEAGPLAAKSEPRELAQTTQSKPSTEKGKTASPKKESKKEPKKSSKPEKAPKPKKPDPFQSPDFVKTPAQLKAEFAAIRKMKIEYTGELSGVPQQVTPLLQNKVLQVHAQNELRMLMAYRAVVGVPFEDMTLDRQQTAHAMAASILLTKIGRLEHTPPCPPGYPEEVYQFAYKGTSSSNLFGGKGIAGSVRGYMNDSDPGNIVSLGHRRWCINPKMKTTGFGQHGNYSAMWSFDGSRDLSGFDYDFIAFPARGLTPANMLETSWAWNVSLNPKKYSLAGAAEDVRVKVTPGQLNAKTAKFKKGTQSLPLDSVRVSQEGFGISPCVIFRPKNYLLRPGAVYCVEIDGFYDENGEETTIQYWVVFIQPI